MKASARIGLMLLLWAPAPASAQTYHSEYSAVTFAGGRAQSGRYVVDSSATSLGGLGETSGAVLRLGFAGQLNEPPLTTPDTVNRLPGKSAKVPVADLIGNDTDIEGESLTLLIVDSFSDRGVSISTDGRWVFYESGATSLQPDSFRYFVTDSLGGVSAGEVHIITQPGDAALHLTLLRVEQEQEGNRVIFVGIPGRTYHIQGTDDLGNPAWETIGNASAGTNGVYSVMDLSAGNATRFYRAINF